MYTDETKNTPAIILNRQPYREYDAFVTVYTLAFGKLTLVARGTKKLRSKLAGHIEPLTLADILIVSGKGFDYIGSAITRNAYLGIRENLNKLYYSGRATNIFNRLVKENQADERLFFLLHEWLEILDSFRDGLNSGKNVEPGGERLSGEKTDRMASPGGGVDFSKESGELFFAFFIWKLLAELGYRPDLHNCLVCRRNIKPGNNYFNLLNGGIICPDCYVAPGNIFGFSSREYFPISDNCLKLVRFILDNDFKQIIKLKLDKKIIKEENKLLRDFLGFIG